MLYGYVNFALVKPFAEKHRPNFCKRISETGGLNIYSFIIQFLKYMTLSLLRHI